MAKDLTAEFEEDRDRTLEDYEPRQEGYILDKSLEIQHWPKQPGITTSIVLGH